MKKALNIFATMIAVILLCGITVSCSKDDDPEVDPTPTTVAQTIIVFHPYADNLTTNSFLQTDLNEMKSAIKTNGSMSNYRVVVYYGNSSTKATLFELKLKDGVVINDTISSYTSVVQNDETYLTNVFKKIKETAPANAYKILSGSHGSGWLPSTVDYSLIPIASSSDWSSSSKSIRKSFGGLSTENLRINITTFSNVLTNAGIKPIKFILFDNCLMSNIETAWDLKGNTDYIVATPAEQPGEGFPYDQIWNNILATTSVSTLQSICQTFIDYYAAKHNGYKDPSSNYVSPATIAVINCSAVEQIANDMKMINQSFPEIKSDQLSKVQRYDYKEVGIFYDILSYAAKRIGDGYATDATYQVLKDAVNDAVPIKMNGGYYLANDRYCFPITQTDYSGCGCSDPSINSEAVDNKKATNWWKATH